MKKLLIILMFIICCSTVFAIDTFTRANLRGEVYNSSNQTTPRYNITGFDIISANNIIGGANGNTTAEINRAINDSWQRNITQQNCTGTAKANSINKGILSCGVDVDTYNTTAEIQAAQLKNFVINNTAHIALSFAVINAPAACSVANTFTTFWNGTLQTCTAIDGTKVNGNNSDYLDGYHFNQLPYLSNSSLNNLAVGTITTYTANQTFFKYGTFKGTIDLEAIPGFLGGTSINDYGRAVPFIVNKTTSITMIKTAPFCAAASVTHCDFRVKIFNYSYASGDPGTLMGTTGWVDYSVLTNGTWHNLTFTTPVSVINGQQYYYLTSVNTSHCTGTGDMLNCYNGTTTASSGISASDYCGSADCSSGWTDQAGVVPAFVLYDTTGTLEYVTPNGNTLKVGGTTNITGTLYLYSNMTMQSPDGTRYNCGVANGGNFGCN